MCVRSLSDQRELYLKHLTRAQASFYSVTVGGCVQAQPGIHPFMQKPRPPRLLSIRPSSAERQGPSGCSGPLPACSCLQRHSHILPLAVHQTPSTSSVTQSLGEGKTFIHTVLTEIPNAAQQSVQEWMTRLLNCGVEQPSREATCSLVFLNSGCLKDKTLLDSGLRAKYKDVNFTY